MKKTCIVCGNEFEAAQSNYTICSDECRQKRKLEHYKKYGQKYCKKYTYADKYAKSHNKIVLCRFCGEKVLPEYLNGRFHRFRYHQECLIDKGIKAMQNGEIFGKSKTLKIVTNKGFTKRELIDIANERGIEI